MMHSHVEVRRLFVCRRRLRLKIFYCPDRNEPYEQVFRKKQFEAVAQIDEAIKKGLDELESQPRRRAAFLRLLVCVRVQTSLLKPFTGPGGPGWLAPIFLINRLNI